MSGLVKVDRVDPQTVGAGIEIKGRTSASSFAAGYVGEVQDSSVTPGTVNAVGSNSYTTITSLSLTAGVWLLNGSARQDRNGATSTNYQYLGCGFGTTTNAAPNIPGSGITLLASDGGTNATIRDTWAITMASAIPVVYFISATTTVYFIALPAPYTGGPVTLGGRFVAVRIA